MLTVQMPISWSRPKLDLYRVAQGFKEPIKRTKEPAEAQLTVHKLQKSHRSEVMIGSRLRRFEL